MPKREMEHEQSRNVTANLIDEGVLPFPVWVYFETAYIGTTHMTRVPKEHDVVWFGGVEYEITDVEEQEAPNGKTERYEVDVEVI